MTDAGCRICSYFYGPTTQGGCLTQWVLCKHPTRHGPHSYTWPEKMDDEKTPVLPPKKLVKESDFDDYFK